MTWPEVSMLMKPPNDLQVSQLDSLTSEQQKEKSSLGSESRSVACQSFAVLANEDETDKYMVPLFGSVHSQLGISPALTD